MTEQAQQRSKAKGGERAVRRPCTADGEFFLGKAQDAAHARHEQEGKVSNRQTTGRPDGWQLEGRAGGRGQGWCRNPDLDGSVGVYV